MKPSSALRLIEPDHWTCPHGQRQRPAVIETFGPEVADVNAKAGFAPDPQQELALDLIFAIRPDGSPASMEFCVICCRQNLKTGLFKQTVIGWLFVTEQPLIVWSAHEMSTTLEAQRELGDLIAGAPALRRHMLVQKNDGIYSDNGSERIELATGQRVMFKARTISGGRGLAAPKLILDEFFAAKAAMLGSLAPLMLAQVDPQILYGSSAGKKDSEALRDVRDRGRAGSTDRMSYLEWLAEKEPCADEDCTHPKDALKRGIDCALDREHLLRAANPTLSTGRITLETVRGLRQILAPEEFMRECLGWWDEPDDGAAATFGPGRWERCAVEPADLAEVMPEAPAAIGVAVSVDRTWASIAAASMVEVLEDPNDPEAEPVERVFVGAVDRREDVRWLFDELARIQRETDCVVVVAEKGPAEDLEQDFEDNDVAIEVVSTDDYAEACSRFYDKVRSALLLHPSSGELNDAISGATWRNVGDRRVWGRRLSAVDISMLEAATLAVHGAEKFGAFTIH